MKNKGREEGNKTERAAKGLEIYEFGKIDKEHV